MSYNTNPPRADYQTVADQTIFTFSFKIFFTEDLTVYRTVTLGTAPILLLEGVDYTVTINGDFGGTATFTSPEPANQYIVLRRDLDIDRFTEFQRSGDLLANTLNADQDYQTYLIADLRQLVDDSIGVSPGTPGFSGDLPTPLSEAYLRWNYAGTALENDTIPPTWRTETEQFRDDADKYRLDAFNWANAQEDQEVDDGVRTGFSAYHWSQVAKDSAAVVDPSNWLQRSGDIATGQISGILAVADANFVVAKAYGSETLGGTAKYKLVGDVLYITTDGTVPGA